MNGYRPRPIDKQPKEHYPFKRALWVTFKWAVVCFAVVAALIAIDWLYNQLKLIIGVAALNGIILAIVIALIILIIAWLVYAVQNENREDG